MDLRTLQIFAEVARRDSFTAVARDRGLEPSSVSRAVAALEAELGVRLVQRSTRRLALTEAGKVYLERIEPVLAAAADAADEARSLGRSPVGVLRLTASVAFAQAWITPRLPRLRAAFPGLAVELRVTDAALDLLAERIDLAIRLGPRPPVDGVAVRLMATRYRVVAAPAYLALAPPLAQPGDLRAHRCLRFALPEFRTRWMFRQDGMEDQAAAESVEVEGDVIASSALTLLDCARAGMGPALLPDWLTAAPIAARELVDALPGFQGAGPSFDTAAWLLYPSRTLLPNKVRAAIDFFRREAREP